MLLFCLSYYILQVRYDRRVRVVFQKKAWCDEQVMLGWIQQQWKTVCDGDMLLVLDVHKAEKTDTVAEKFLSRKTSTVYIPPGCTSIIQPLDVSINAPFKAIVNRLATDHWAQNLQAYVEGTISASQRRVLLSQWVGQAWEELSANKEMIKRSFKKCGISVPIDGSKDDEIKIEGLDEYSVKETDVDGASQDEEDDMEADFSDDDPFV